MTTTTAAQPLDMAKQTFDERFAIDSHFGWKPLDYWIAGFDAALIAQARAAKPAGAVPSEEEVSGIAHPTTYADLARITPLQLWNRWYPRDRSVDAREAFIAARRIPFVSPAGAADTTASASIYVRKATLDHIAASSFVKHEITVRTEPNEGWVALTAQPVQAGEAVDELQADIKHLVKLADNVGRSRQSNNYAMNSTAVEKLVDLQTSVLKRVASLAPVSAQQGAAEQACKTCGDSGWVRDQHDMEQGLIRCSDCAAKAPAAQAVDTHLDALRQRQALAVMPLIGPLLDAYEGTQKADLAEMSPSLVRHLKAINQAMECDKESAREGGWNIRTFEDEENSWLTLAAPDGREISWSSPRGSIGAQVLQDFSIARAASPASTPEQERE
jgi:hypothetical protein